MKWKILLNGDITILKSFSQDTIVTDELSIVEEMGQFIMTCPEFDSLNSVEDVKQKADELIEQINGLTYYLLNSNKTISTNSISWSNNQGGTDSVVFPETVELNISQPQPSTLSINKDGSIIESSPIISIRGFLHEAQNDPKKTKILRLLSYRNLDWVSLYRIYEVIFSEVGTRIFSWVNKSKIKNFKHTSNSVSSIGDAARHGIEKEALPSNPMTLIEAQKIIMLIIEKYLSTK